MASGEIDLIAYISCLTNFLIFPTGNYGIFAKKVAQWVQKNENKIEICFWKASDGRLQQLLSDALLAVYPTSILKLQMREN